MCRDLYVDRVLIDPNDVDALEVVDDILARRDEQSDAFGQVCFRLRVHFDQALKKGELASVRFRSALSLTERLAFLIESDRESISASLPSVNVDDKQVRRIRSVFANQLAVAKELRFSVYREVQASRVLRPAQAEGQFEIEEARFQAAQLELLRLLIPSMKALARGASPAAAHELLEALAPYIDELPRDLFPVVAAIVRGAKDVGFGAELMAASLVVRIIEQYLTSHPGVIEESDDRRRELIECLDVFATWPEALRLVYRFDEVFR
jgi:hypothetical protein